MSDLDNYRHSVSNCTAKGQILELVLYALTYVDMVLLEPGVEVGRDLILERVLRRGLQPVGGEVGEAHVEGGGLGGGAAAAGRAGEAGGAPAAASAGLVGRGGGRRREGEARAAAI